MAAKLQFRSDLTIAQLAELIDAVEFEIRRDVPTATRIFIEPDVLRPASPIE